MSRLYFFGLLLCVAVVAVSCVPDEDSDPGGMIFCSEDGKCPPGMTCDTEQGVCIADETNDDSGDTGNTGFPDDSGDSGDNTDDDPGSADDAEEDDGDPVLGDCNPGDIKECEYTGPEGTKDVGVCRAAQAICQNDHTWGPCSGEVLPSYDLCHNAEDDDCDGEMDNGPDDDGDGFHACEGDCCDNTDDCPDPAAVNPDAEEVFDGIDNDCDDDVDEDIVSCDDTVNITSKDASEFARAMDLCSVKDDHGYGVVEAGFYLADGSGSISLNSISIFNGFGAIAPMNGVTMIGLSSGEAVVPFSSPTTPGGGGMGTSSPPPNDWYTANGEVFPNSPDCGSGSESGGDANDPVMFKMVVKAPETAKAFKFNLFFLSWEFPQFVCSTFNDFFVALLDSEFTSDDPELQNPADKNLARDDNDNQVGVNLAQSGLFHVCEPSTGYPDCTGTGLLAGTGFQAGLGGFMPAHGGTGWLVTQGNINPGEEFTLRLAIWDAGDHVYDSIILLDNFQWLTEEIDPGTGDS